jgi:hypothetical protein
MKNSIIPETTTQLKPVPGTLPHKEQLPSGSVLTPSGRVATTGSVTPWTSSQAIPESVSNNNLVVIMHSERLHNRVSSAEMIDAAKRYTEASLSVIPVTQEKTPAVETWSAYQQKIADESTLKQWFSKTANQLAIVCGAVSQNLEIIDFDEQYNLDSKTLFESWKETVEFLSPGLVDRLVCQRTQHNGFHVVYRGESVGRNVKLAQRESTELERTKEPKNKSKTLAETRGEGGYFLVFPSNDYSMISGNLLEIPKISREEREILIECASSLNQYVLPSQIITGRAKSGKKDSNRPGDDFEEHGDIEDVLIENGWRKVKEGEPRDYWCRPGKAKGVSATYNKKMDLLYVFSSNATPFENERAYSKFAIYSFLKHGGNFKSAAKELAQEGYGEKEQAAVGESILMKVENYLGAHYDFRMNVVTQRLEFRAKTDEDFKRLEDPDLNTLSRELNHHHLIIPFTNLRRLLESDFSPVVDPIKEYFNSLDEWDRTTDFIGSLSETVTLKYREDREVFRKSLRRWLIGQVACASDPNETNHTAIILVGAQGIGKSSWLNRLIPPSLSRYGFIGTINPDNKDTLIYMSEKILINLDELETLTKTDIGSLKTIMTMPSINLRRPYDTYSRELPRRASFVGSINKDEFLKDPTGSRRFLTFDVTAVDYRHSIDMNNVYAQAYSLFGSKEPWWFNETENAEISLRNKKHMQRTYEHELLIESFEHGLDGDVNSSWKSTSEIAAELAELRGPHYKVDHASVTKLGQALTCEGYPVKIKHGGIKQYCIQKVEGV